MLWIGGAPASGKTTIAMRLARRYGLRWYGADTRTWVHRDRALAAGIEAAHRWEASPSAERGDAPPEELLAMSLHRERGQMVVDDVRELPNAPLVVAEGTTVPASVISSGITDADHSVWLVSTAEFQRSQLANHSAGARKLYTILGDAITRETEVHGAPVIQVDGQRGVDEIFELVEDRFTYAIHDGSRAETIDERRGLLREANIAVVEQVRDFYRRLWAEGDPETVVRIFVCECGDTYCEADVEATVLDAAAQPVVAAGHG